MTSCSEALRMWVDLRIAWKEARAARFRWDVHCVNALQRSRQANSMMLCYSNQARPSCQKRQLADRCCTMRVTSRLEENSRLPTPCMHVPTWSAAQPSSTKPSQAKPSPAQSSLADTHTSRSYLEA